MKNSALRIFYIFSLALILSNCITTNYYTARTLEQGKTVMTPGVDNLIWIEEDEGIVKKDVAFTPSLGIATGLPWRFETGIRFYFPYVLEANLRQQLNPRTFKWFDLSANFHMGVCFVDDFEDISEPYYKYGFTISKEILTLQPYLGYYLNNSFLMNGDSDDLSDYTVICFGLAIPFKGNLIFPEWNYYRNEDGDGGFFSFGLGIRASLNESKSVNSAKAE